MNRINEAGYTLVELLLLIGILVFGIGGVSLLIWVVIHFLKKVW